MVLVMLATTRPSEPNETVPMHTKQKRREQIAEVLYVKNDAGQQQDDENRWQGKNEIGEDTGSQHVAGSTRELRESVARCLVRER